MSIRSYRLALVVLIFYLLARSLSSQGPSFKRNDAELLLVPVLVGRTTARIDAIQEIHVSPDEEEAGDVYEEEIVHTSAGCGRSTEEKPLWIPYRKIDEVRLWGVQQCIARVDDFKFPEHREIRSMNRARHMKLGCSQQFSDSDVLAILGRYRNITFFGDSVLYHQVVTLFCMLDPNLYRAPIEFEPVRVFRPAYNLYKLRHNSNRTTYIRYVPYATDWGPKVRKAFWEKIEQSVEKSTPSDAIFLNGGAHVASTEMKKFQSYLDSAANLTNQARCPVYYVESSHEEWPTSNGIFTPSCRDENEEGLCECEAISQDRLQGRGKATGNAQQDMGKLDPAPKEMLRILPADSVEWLKTDEAKSCAPDCLPATRRNDFVRWKLQENNSPMRVVPMFRQVAALDQLQSRGPGDCNHKSSVVLVEMMKQVLRIMDEDSKGMK